MIRTCAACGGDLVPFAVPDGLGPYTPDEDAAGDDSADSGEAGDIAALCSYCLRTYTASDGSDASHASETADFRSVADYFPRGDGGAATALLLGMLDSLALNRPAIEALAERAEREGVDVLLTLDRIDGDADLDPHFDVGRRRAQVEQILG